MKHQRFLKKFLITIKLLFHRASTVDKKKIKTKGGGKYCTKGKIKK